VLTGPARNSKCRVTPNRTFARTDGAFPSPTTDTYGGLHVLSAPLPAFREHGQAINVVPEIFAGKTLPACHFRLDDDRVPQRRRGLRGDTCSRRNTKGAASSLIKQGFLKAAVPEFVLLLSPDGRALAENLL